MSSLWLLTQILIITYIKALKMKSPTTMTVVIIWLSTDVCLANYRKYDTVALAPTITRNKIENIILFLFLNYYE